MDKQCLPFLLPTELGGGEMHGARATLAALGLLVALAVLFVLAREQRPQDRFGDQNVESFGNSGALSSSSSISALRADDLAPESASEVVHRSEVPRGLVVLYESEATEIPPGEIKVFRIGEAEQASLINLSTGLPRQLELAWEGELVPGSPNILERPQPGEYLFLARVPGHYAMETVEPIDEETYEVRHALTEASAIACTVINEDGAPVPFSLIRMLPSDRMGISASGDARAAVTGRLPIESATDEKGIARFTSPSAALSRLHVIPPDPYAELLIWDVSPGDQVHAVVSAGASIIGEITDLSGKPIPDCNVAVYKSDESGAELPIGSTRTDSHGLFRLERMDPRAGSWSVFAEKPDWEMKRQRILKPAAGKVYSLSFQLQPAAAAGFQLIDGSGHPINGVGVHLLGSAQSEVPFTWITDDNGQFVTGPHLVEGVPYTLQCIFGGITMNAQSLILGQNRDMGKSQEIVIPSIGQLISTPRIHQEGLSEIEIELSGSFPPEVLIWRPPFNPQWLPAGDYLASGFINGTFAGQKNLRIRANTQTLIDGLQSTATFKFEVTAPQGLLVSIISQANIVVWEQTAAAGQHAVPLPVGDYFISCRDAASGAWDSQPFRLGPEGYHYGQLGTTPESRASIAGVVHSKRGTPIPGSILVVTNLDGYRTARVFAQEDGNFMFSGLPMGKYLVTCDSRAALGVPEAVQSKSVSLFEEEARASVEFRFDNELAVDVLLPQRAVRASEGFCISEGSSQFYSIDASCSFRVQPLGREGLVGACFSPSTGQLEVLCGALSSQTAKVDLASNSIPRRTKIIHAGADMAGRGFAAQVEYGGLRLGDRVCDEAGELQVHYTPFAGLRVVLFLDDGQTQWMELTNEHPALVERQARELAPWFVVAGENSRERETCSVYLDCCSIRLRAEFGTKIYTRCGRERHSLFVDAQRYVEQGVSVSDGETITLASAAALRVLDCASLMPQAHSIIIRALATGDVLARLPLSEGGVAECPELPVGGYELTALSIEGVIVAERVVQLRIDSDIKLAF